MRDPALAPIAWPPRVVTAWRVDAIDQLKRAMRDAGLEPPEVIKAGKLHRFSTNGKAGDDAGWCKLFSDRRGGVFGDYRSGLSGHWEPKTNHVRTQAKREDFQREIADAKRQGEAEERKRHAKAATKAAAIWKAATPASADHPYLARKQVSPVSTLREIDASAVAEILGYAPKAKGEALSARFLVVPVKIGERLSTCELIDGEGRKAAIYGGAKAGGYWEAQPLPEGDGTGLTLMVGEGVATVLSAKEAAEYPVIATLSAGNLPAVATAMRERYPTAILVLLADLVKATGEPDPHAIEAARSVGGLLAIPDFGNDRPDRAKDFNDVAVLCGTEAVTRAIANAMDPEYSEDGVTGVTRVQANSDAGFGCNPKENGGVTGVTNLVPAESDRPIFRVFDEWVRHGGAKYRPGVWYFGKPGKGNAPPVLTQEWVCAPLYVEAVTFDAQENNFGRMLRNIAAAVRCKDPVERLAKYTARWTDRTFEPKFSHFRWFKESEGIIIYIGDKIEFQNGFGAWQAHVYECDYDPKSEQVLDVRARPGRL